MIADEFPDPQAIDMNPNSPCYEEGWTTFIFNGESSSIYFPEHEGPLSLKCAFGGTENYNFGGMTYKVQSNSYLILNEGRRYSSWIDDGGVSVESFCLFFSHQYAADIARAMSLGHKTLLDNPNVQAKDDIPHFAEKLYPQQGQIAVLLAETRALLKNGIDDSLLLEQQARTIMQAMYSIHQETAVIVERIDAVRSSTRMELYRRVEYAREYMEAEFRSALTLKHIASLACLSVHHFVRLFKAVYSMPPYEYLIRKRIDYACTLLRETHLSITEIGGRVGFESLSTFSRMFSRYCGCSPSAYRSQCIVEHIRQYK